MIFVDGRKIRELRKKLGLTQAELGVYAGVEQSMISYYEDGRKTPAVDTLAHIAIRLGVTVDELLSKAF